MFPCIFSLTEGKYGSVKDHMVISKSFCSQLRRNLNDWEVEEWVLLKILDDYSLCNSELDDERIWVFDESHGFSVKSLYEVLVQGESPFPTHFIWKSLTPSKISFFL